MVNMSNASNPQHFISKTAKTLKWKHF